MTLYERFKLLCERGHESFEMAQSFMDNGDPLLAKEELHSFETSKAQALLIVRNCPRLARLAGYTESVS